jgi:SNF2 family DNA or RNA helicase
MKTKGMTHQLEALRRMQGRVGFALLMEQGTGKTWTLLADAERNYAAGIIDAVLVFAPKGVHTNWVRREIPAHLGVDAITRVWRAGMGKRERAKLDDLLRPREVGEVPPLRVLAMNFDALMSKDAMAFARSFLRATNAMAIVDESGRIKNPNAERTQRLMLLRDLAKLRRIATGTPVTNAPMDVFSQMEFLEEGLLGTTSYRAFVAEYAELMDKDHPMFKRMIEENPRIARAQIVAKNPDGSPRWRNLDKLQGLLLPHSYRVLKRDCLDLPDKIYKTVYFELAPAQRAAYELMKEDLRIKLEDGTLEPVAALAALVKLQQITSGFVIKPEGGVLYVDEKNPRLDALVDALEDVDGAVLVWARFKEEITAAAAALRKAGRRVVEYHGAVSAKDREAAVDAIQSGAADAFVGNAQAGGIGLTLTRAENTVYFSNDWNLGTRLQSEDRNHRIGTRNNVVYIDLVASDTIDESIARALQRKEGMAAAILGDTGLDFRSVHELEAPVNVFESIAPAAIDAAPPDPMDAMFAADAGAGIAPAAGGAAGWPAPPGSGR